VPEAVTKKRLSSVLANKFQGVQGASRSSRMHKDLKEFRVLKEFKVLLETLVVQHLIIPLYLNSTAIII
jgi:hypothetical protein